MWNRTLTLLVKPTHKCNLNCEYCYDRPNREQIGDCIMSLDLVQDIVDRLPADRSICWTWHGGECSTVPVEWFEKACEIIRSRFDLNISMVMQSNGYDVPDEFLKMCIHNSIHIGFSYDFDTQATRSGNADVDPVADTLDRSRKLGIHTGAITVIHNKNVHKMVDYYEAAKTRWNYTPAFNHVFSSPNASKYNISLNEDSYWTHFRKFANHVIYDKDLDATVERTFEVGIQTVIGLPAALCSFSNCSYVYICIDPVGRCLPCDRTYPEHYIYKDLRDFEVITDYFKTPQYQKWVYTHETRLRHICKKCNYYPMCKGCCPTNHCVDTNDNPYAVSVDQCTLHRNVWDISWEIMNNLNPYEDQINTQVSRDLIYHEYFIPCEVRKFIPRIGLKLKEVDAKHWTESPEFTILKEINFRTRARDHDSQYITPYDWECVELSRLRLFREKIRESFDSLRNVIEGELDDIL